MPRLRKYCGSNLVLFLSFPANKCKVLAGKKISFAKKIILNTRENNQKSYSANTNKKFRVTKMELL